MGLSDYSDLEKEIKDAPEPKVLPRGTEVTARIIRVQDGVDKNDNEYHMVYFDVPDDPMVVEFNIFMYELDREGLNEKQYARALSSFQKFAAAFDIDYSRPFSWEDDLPGKTGDMILGYKKDEEYGDKNTVKQFVAGR